MNYIYDPEADALYVSLIEGTVNHTVELDDGVVVDVAEDGTALGIDVMVPSGGWSADQIVSQFALGESAKGFLELLAHVGWPRLGARTAQPEPARNVQVRHEAVLAGSA